MTAREFIIQNNDLLIHTTENITKGYHDYMELYQCVIEQILLKPEKMDQIEDEKKLFYFIKIVKNNFYSKTSQYQYQRLKYKNKNVEYKDELEKKLWDETEDYPYPEWKWIEEQLNDMEWFDRDLFLLWAQLGTLTKVHQETTIPINSVGKYIKNIKDELKKRWINK